MVLEILSLTDRSFCQFGSFFVLLPAMDPENENTENIKKAPGDIIILQICTINGNHMMYVS